MASNVAATAAALAQVEGMDTETQKSAQDRVSQMNRDAIKFQFHQRLKKNREDRARVPSRAHKEKLKEQRQRRVETGQKRLLKESSEAAEGKHAEDDILTSSWKGDAVTMKAKLFVKKHVDWAWRLTKWAITSSEDNDKPSAIVQFKFVSPDTEHFDKVVLSVIIIVMRGHVWAFSTTDMGGMDEMINNLSDKTLLLRKDTRLATLPSSRFFSKRFDKAADNAALRIRDITMKHVPFLQTPFFAGKHVPTDIVEANAITQEEFEAAFPTKELQLELNKKVAAHVNKLKMEEMRNIAQAKREKESQKHEPAVAPVAPVAAAALSAEVPVDTPLLG